MISVLCHSKFVAFFLDGILKLDVLILAVERICRALKHEKLKGFFVREVRWTIGVREGVNQPEELEQPQFNRVDLV